MISPVTRSARTNRGRRSAWWAVGAVGAVAAAGTAQGQARRVERIDYVVQDARLAARFYEQALGFVREGEVEAADSATARRDGLRAVRTRTVTLRLGADRLGLVQYLAPAGGRPWPAGSRSQDRWFQHFSIAVANMDRAYAHLLRFAPAAISRGGPQTLPPRVGSVRVFKFRDPDGHPVELVHFPPGTGRLAWHVSAGQPLFLGIDHTALGIGDTPRSLAFYRDLLGLKVVGGVLTQGLAQARMDDVPNVLVRITALRGATNAGPGVEFLQYLRPSNGRDVPADARSNDIWAARIELAVDDLDGLAARLTKAGVRFVSPGVVRLPGPAAGKALTVLDPDGHRVLLLQH